MTKPIDALKTIARYVDVIRVLTGAILDVILRLTGNV
jgi:hypothetical protein